jgi:hypothetical protein
MTSSYRRLGYHALNIVFAYLPIVSVVAASQPHWVKSDASFIRGAARPAPRVTAGLVSSLSAPFPTQRAAAWGEPASRRATFTAAALSAVLRLPIARRAQLTPHSTAVSTPDAGFLAECWTFFLELII